MREMRPSQAQCMDKTPVRALRRSGGKARRLLGYEPRISLAAGMEELVQWVREQEVVDSLDSAARELTSHGLVS